MRVLAGLLVLGLVTAPLRDTGSPMTAQERATLIAQLEQSRDRFLTAVNGVSELQWAYKPAPNRWSVGEVAEHIAATDAFVLSLVRGSLLQSPEQPRNPGAAAVEQRIRSFMGDRTAKAQAPEVIAPNGRWPTKTALVAAYRQQRDALIRYVRTTQDPVRDHVSPHPLFGPLDGYQWMLLIAWHGDRHVQQMGEVKLAAGYPR